MEANILEAEETFQLVDAAQRGEEVIIERNGMPVAQMVPIAKKEFPFGFLKGKVGDIPDSLLFGDSDEQLEDFTRCLH